MFCRHNCTVLLYCNQNNHSSFKLYIAYVRCWCPSRSTQFGPFYSSSYFPLDRLFCPPPLRLHPWSALLPRSALPKATHPPSPWGLCCATLTGASYYVCFDLLPVLWTVVCMTASYLPTLLRLLISISIFALSWAQLLNMNFLSSKLHEPRFLNRWSIKSSCRHL